MNILELRKLVETQPMKQLVAAELALLEEGNTPFYVVGEDDSEKLTHLLAAINILEIMKSKGVEFKQALQDYSRSVRESQY